MRGPSVTILPNPIRLLAHKARFDHNCTMKACWPEAASALCTGMINKADTYVARRLSLTKEQRYCLHCAKYCFGGFIVDKADRPMSDIKKSLIAIQKGKP